MRDTPARATTGWCSLQFRFDAGQLALLQAAERAYGAILAASGRPDTLRTALALARVGRKVARTDPGGALNVSQLELGLLVTALRAASAELQWLADQTSTRQDAHERARREAILAAFPELAQGGWRTFGVRRALEALERRLSAPTAGLPPA